MTSSVGEGVGKGEDELVQSLQGTLWPASLTFISVIPRLVISPGETLTPVHKEIQARTSTASFFKQ